MLSVSDFRSRGQGFEPQCCVLEQDSLTSYRSGLILVALSNYELLLLTMMLHHTQKKTTTKNNNKKCLARIKV